MDPITTAVIIIIFVIAVLDTVITILSKKEKNLMQKDIDFWRKEAIKANNKIKDLESNVEEDIRGRYWTCLQSYRCSMLHLKDSNYADDPDIQKAIELYESFTKEDIK